MSFQSKLKLRGKTENLCMFDINIGWLTVLETVISGWVIIDRQNILTLNKVTKKSTYQKEGLLAEPYSQLCLRHDVHALPSTRLRVLEFHFCGWPHERRLWWTNHEVGLWNHHKDCNQGKSLVDRHQAPWWEIELRKFHYCDRKQWPQCLLDHVRKPSTCLHQSTSFDCLRFLTGWKSCWTLPLVWYLWI